MGCEDFLRGRWDWQTLPLGFTGLPHRESLSDWQTLSERSLSKIFATRSSHTLTQSDWTSFSLSPTLSSFADIGKSISRLHNPFSNFFLDIFYLTELNCLWNLVRQNKFECQTDPPAFVFESFSATGPCLQERFTWKVSPGNSHRITKQHKNNTNKQTEWKRSPGHFL